MNKCWVARSDFLDISFSKKFDSARECSEYIDSELVIINYLLGRLYYQFYLLKMVDNIRFSDSYIRPYNTVDKRYCDGFDF